MKIHTIIFISLFFASCISKKNDIYLTIPKKPQLDIPLMRESNSIFKVDSKIGLIYNLTQKYSDEYNPHLLFFDNKKLLKVSCYFLSENIYSINDGIITAYLNDNRMSKKRIYRNDLPKGIKIKYLNYKTEFPHGNSYHMGSVNKIIYGPKNETIDLILDHFTSKEDKFLSIPLFKITYNYEKEMMRYMILMMIKIDNLKYST